MDEDDEGEEKIKRILKRLKMRDSLMGSFSSYFSDDGLSETVVDYADKFLAQQFVGQRSTEVTPGLSLFGRCRSDVRFELGMIAWKGEKLPKAVKTWAQLLMKSAELEENDKKGEKRKRKIEYR